MVRKRTTIMNIEIINSVNHWNSIHKSYERESIKVDNWLDAFEDIISKEEKAVLDLGCGSGNDTLYLINKGKKVYAADLSDNAISNIRKNFPEVVEAGVLNMLDGINYDDDMFGIVIADLSLHYFTLADTDRVLQDLRRILKPDGHLLIRVNTINDTNYGAGSGEEVEHHLYKTEDGMLKRFFSEDDIELIFKDFDIFFMEEQKMLRYRSEKSVYCVGMRVNK